MKVPPVARVLRVLDAELPVAAVAVAEDVVAEPAVVVDLYVESHTLTGVWKRLLTLLRMPDTLLARKMLRRLMLSTPLRFYL